MRDHEYQGGDNRNNGRRDNRKKEQPPVHLTNFEAERILIGKLLQNESLFWEIAGTLHNFHFARKIHDEIFTAIQTISYDGKKPTLSLLVARLGPEYDDGASVMTLMTALIRDAADIENIDAEMRLVIELWQRRRMIELCEFSMKEAKRPDVDTGYMLADMEAAIKDISVNSQAEPLQTMAQITANVVKRSIKTQETGKAPGFDTGLPSLDEILGRIHPGDFGFICAKQGDAKTVLGLQIANRAQLFMPSIVFELEMRKEDLGRRALAGSSNVSVSQIEEGAYDMFAQEELIAAQVAFENSRCYVDDRPKLRIDQIYDRCMALKRSKGLGIVVIDHLRLVKATGKYNNKFDRIEYVTGEMKAMAKDLDIAVIALSQVTRNSQRRDDPSPTLTDTDGGASIEQDADWAIGLFRRDRHLKTIRPHDMETPEGQEWSKDWNACKGQIEMKILKRRRGDDGEMRKFQFDGRRGMILELER